MILKRMRYGLILLMTLWMNLIVNAQSREREISWNYIPDEHLDMPVYDFDKKAEAVILYDLGVWSPLSLETNLVRLQRHKRIKILKESGVRHKEIVIEYKKDEKVIGLKARTINIIEGKKKVVKLDLKHLPEEKVNDDTRQKSFAFRDVKPGSIIEYQYEFQTNEMEWLRPWYFQSEIPTLHSEVRLDNFGPIRFSAFPQILEVQAYIRGRYRMRHIAALPRQDWVVNWNDYRAGLRFQLNDQFELRSEAREWQLITMDLQQSTLFFDDSVRLEALFSLAQSLARDAITEEEKVALIYDHIRKNIRWNQKSTTWMSKTPSQTYKDREGSSVEINMLLTQLLWLADIKAMRLFYRTRDKGIPTFYPIRNQFNDMLCVAKADGQTFFLDATEPLRPYELMPQRALNRMGWLVKDSTANWVNMPKKFAGSRNVIGLVSIKEDASFSAEIKEVYAGYSGLEMKESMRGKEEATFINSFVKANTENLKITGHKEPDKPVTLSYELKTGQFVQKQKNKIVISPLIHFQRQETPLKDNSRAYPVDFGYNREVSYFISYLIPEGYTVENLPKGTRLRTFDDKLLYEFVITHSGQTIQLKSTLKIGKPVFETDEYSAAKELFEKIIAKQKEEIVLIPSP